MSGLTPELASRLQPASGRELSAVKPQAAGFSPEGYTRKFRAPRNT